MAERSEKKQFEFHNVVNQYYAVLSGECVPAIKSSVLFDSYHSNLIWFIWMLANFIMFSHGCTVGWVAPALMFLMSDSSSLTSGPLTMEQVSWIGSMSCIGALFGTLSFGVFTSFMGCKRAMVFLAIPAVMYWLTILFGNSANYIIFARFLGGWTGGGIQSSIILFVAEIADDR